MKQVLIAIDQLINTLIGGMADETISARAYRKGWVRRAAFINWLFRDPKHCHDAYEAEKQRTQAPKDYREGMSNV